MKRDRRDFLRTSLAAGATVTLGAGARAFPAAAAPGARAQGPSQGLPTGLTLLHVRQGDGVALAVKTARGILDVAQAARVFKADAPATIDLLIREGDRGLTALVGEAVEKGPASLFADGATVQHGPCVTNPQKIVCVGLNYARHARETNSPVPTLPILFNKFNNALNWHGGTVRVSAVPATNFDYEAELVIVMGRRASHVSEADALSYVFGYCTGNDFTARDLQSRSSQWMIGKTCDGFAPLGPHLLTADLVGDPNKLTIECLVNGEVRQSSNSADMIFNCAKIISYASSLMTLEPGDIIFTGTPEGVIAGYPKERQVWLKPGDRIVTRIEKTGVLEFSLT